MIESKNPTKAAAEENSKNFDNSSIKSGGVASHAGSVLNEVNRRYNIIGALSSLSAGGDLNSQLN